MKTRAWISLQFNFRQNVKSFLQGVTFETPCAWYNWSHFMSHQKGRLWLLPSSLSNRIFFTDTLATFHLDIYCLDVHTVCPWKRVCVCCVVFQTISVGLEGSTGYRWRDKTSVHWDMSTRRAWPSMSLRKAHDAHTLVHLIPCLSYCTNNLGEPHLTRELWVWHMLWYMLIYMQQTSPSGHLGVTGLQSLQYLHLFIYFLFLLI